MSGGVLKLPDAAVEQNVFSDGCPLEQLTLAPRRRLQARVSSRAGGLALTSATGRRPASAVDSVCETLLSLVLVLNG